MLYLDCEEQFHGDIPEEKFNIIMRCAHYGKGVIKEYLDKIQKICESKNMDARFLNQSFKNLLVPKEMVYQNSDSTGIIK